MCMRKEFLIELLKLDTISGNEEIMIPRLLKELNELGFEYKVDDMNNIYATRGKADKYPLLNAHMDIVDCSWCYPTSSLGYNSSIFYGDDTPEFEEKELLDNLLNIMSLSEIKTYFRCKDCSRNCEYNKTAKKPCEIFDIKEEGYDKLRQIARDWGFELPTKESKDDKNTSNGYEIYEHNDRLVGSGGRVLGGDDKCGIFIALEIARMLKDAPMKILFTTREEEGCIGVKYFVTSNKQWFNDVAYSITIDRKEGDNLLWSQLRTRSCSDNFASRLALSGIINGIPVKIMDGNVADVIHIRELVTESVNVSAGYYDAHTESEYVILSDVERIIKWLKHFITTERGCV